MTLNLPPPQKKKKGKRKEKPISLCSQHVVRMPPESFLSPQTPKKGCKRTKRGEGREKEGIRR